MPSHINPHAVGDAIAVIKAFDADDPALTPLVGCMSETELAAMVFDLAALVLFARDSAPGMPLDQWLNAAASAASPDAREDDTPSQQTSNKRSS